MKSFILRKSIIVLIILAPLIADMGCKKQPKCGCGKDVVFEITDGSASVYYIESSRSAYFFSSESAGSTYYFCNPGEWIDTIKVYTQNKQGQTLLITGKAYYECNYLMNSSNYGGYIPPTYQVEVTAIKEDNYHKKK
jgi:hypothetical protein